MPLVVTVCFGCVTALNLQLKACLSALVSGIKPFTLSWTRQRVTFGNGWHLGKGVCRRMDRHFFSFALCIRRKITNLEIFMLACDQTFEPYSPIQKSDINDKVNRGPDIHFGAQIETIIEKRHVLKLYTRLMVYWKRCEGYMVEKGRGEKNGKTGKRVAGKWRAWERWLGGQN